MRTRRECGASTCGDMQRPCAGGLAAPTVARHWGLGNACPRPRVGKVRGHCAARRAAPPPPSEAWPMTIRPAALGLLLAFGLMAAACDAPADAPATADPALTTAPAQPSRPTPTADPTPQPTAMRPQRLRSRPLPPRRPPSPDEGCTDRIVHVRCQPGPGGARRALLRDRWTELDEQHQLADRGVAQWHGVFTDAAGGSRTLTGSPGCRLTWGIFPT